MNDHIEMEFAKAGGRPVDFPQPDYESRKAVFDTIAATHGYRLAGFRLKRAVFSTKEAPSTPDARELTKG